MLLKKITENFRKNSRKECASEELCYFMATLVHGELFSLRVPMLRSNPPLTDENVVRVVQYYNNLLSAAGMVPPSLSEVNQASRGIRMLLNAIETECSSLRSLHLMSLSFFNPLMPLTNDSSLGTVFFRALHRLTNLHIDCYECDDWALMQFATHATNLVVLQVALTPEVSSTGISALTPLQHLKQFIFGDSMPESEWDNESKILVLCSQFLPQLKVSGRRMDLLKVENFYTDGFMYARGYHSEMVQLLLSPCILGLKQLNLCDDNVPNIDVQFPELEELLLWSPSSRALGGLPHRFSTVTALGLFECDETDIIPLLHCVGLRLHSLLLREVGRMFSLAEVLRLCPCLKRLRVFGSRVIQNPEQWPEATFRSIEEADFGSMKLPPGFLKQILQSATKLRKLTITYCSVPNHEMSELVQLMRQKPILPNIVRILWMDYDSDLPESHKEHLDLLYETIRETFPSSLNLLA